jgi:hypothetical protein
MRPTYARDWSAYNDAQTHEEVHAHPKSNPLRAAV